MGLFPNFCIIFKRGLCSASRKRIQVSVLGADTPTGEITTFLLKQNPLISCLHLQGTSKVERMALDLSHFDTNPETLPYYGIESVPKAVKSADIVLLMGLETLPKSTSLPKRVMAEAPRIVSLAESCSKFAPKALIVVCVDPVSVMLPLVMEIYRKTNWYHPGRILGSVALPQVKANSLLGYYQNLDPQGVHVPIVGGPDLDCAIPLFSQATPAAVIGQSSEFLMLRFREAQEQTSMTTSCGINRMVTALALGICGEKSVVSAFVRSNVVGTCRHVVTMVQVGREGVIHNFGLPYLPRDELNQFEKSTLIIQKREEMAAEFMERKDPCSLPRFVLKEIEEEAADKRGILR